MITGRALLTVLSLALLPSLSMATDDSGGAGASSGGTTAGYGAIDAAISEVRNSSDTAATNADPATGGEFGGGAGVTAGDTVAGGGALTADEVRGTIDSIDATRRKLTIRDDQGNLVSYDLQAGAPVQVGRRDSSLSALSHGDTVAVTIADADPTQARAVRVTTAQ